MKLIKLYVSSFGKLKDFSYEFNDGLNVLKHENGWGKSTITMFIKAMFYGIKGSSKHSLSDNERKKYRPWNSTEKFGGYLEFEKDGAIYRVERFFGLKESEDEFKLIDVASGKVYNYSGVLGEKIFGIDEDGFFSTTYFSENDFEASSSHSLTAKFNSTYSVQSSDAFDDAVKSIENKMKVYKVRGGRGLIEDTRQDVKLVIDELERANRAADTSQMIKNEIIDLETKVEALKSEINSLSDKIKDVSLKEAESVKKTFYQNAVKERASIEQQLDIIKSYFNGFVPTADEIDAYTQSYKDYLTVLTNINSISESIDKINSDVKSSQKNKKTVMLSLASILGVFTVGFLIFSILSLFNPWVMVAVTLICLVVIALLLITSFSKNFNSPKTIELDDLKKNLSELLSIKDELKSRIEAFICRFGSSNIDEFYSVILNVKEKISEKIRLEQDLKKCMEIINDLRLSNAYNSDNEQVSAEVLSSELKTKQNHLLQLNRDLADKKAAYARLEETVALIPDLENRKAQLIEQGIAYSEEYDVLSKTLDFLQDADKNLKIKYREPLENSFNKYLKYISSKNINKANLDIDFNVTVEESGVSKEHGFYSKGSRDLFEVCKRFALIEVLFEKEGPFVILDDPFVNLDDNKIKQALQLIKELSKEYQILYFVCHESRAV